MARTTKEEALKTRQKLIETAIDVFYDHGVSATTLEQIADAAQLTRGAFYWHFKNKLDLISAVHDHFHLRILGTIQEQMEQENTPPLERIKNSWRLFLQHILTNTMYRKAMTIFMIKCDYSGEMAALLQQQLNRKAEARQILTQCFQQAIDQGYLTNNYTAEQLVQTHMCYMHGILYEYIAYDKLDILPADSERLMNFHFKNLLAA